jgi:hypothetical protein
VRLHEAGPASAAAFARLYPFLGNALAEIRQALLDYAASQAPRLDAKAQLLAWAFALPELAQRRDALAGFAQLAGASPGIIPSFSQTMESHFRQRPPEQLGKWLVRGFALVRAGRVEEGSAYLCLQSRESRALLGLHGAFLREEQGILRIYADSHCGRNLNILAQDISAFLIDRPYTDGQSLFLPARISLFGASAHNRRAYAALTALLAGTITQGTFGFDLQRLDCRYELGNRYGSLLPEYAVNLRLDFGNRLKTIRERSGNVLEVVLANKRSLTVLETPMERFFYSFPSPHFIRRIFGLLELSRIEPNLARRYEGLGRDFLLINQAALKKLAPLPAADTTRKAQFLEAVRFLFQLRLGLALSAATPATGKLQAEIQSLFAGCRKEGATVETSADIAYRIYNLFFDNFPLANFASELAGATPWDQPFEPRLEFAVVAALSPDLISWPEERQRREPEQVDRIQDVDLTSLGHREKKASALRDEIKNQSVRLFRYPEYDSARASYLPRHCLLFERLVEPGAPDWYDRVLASNRQLSSRIVKKFSAMQPEAVEWTRKWADGDEIHIGDALDYVTDLRRGDSGDDRIYQRKTVNTRDIAVQILVDASSSTLGDVNGQSVIDIEKQALVILTAALHRVGDDFSIAAYNSNGHQKVSFFVAKDFAEPWTALVRSRIAGINPVAANRDGCAIRHATARLSAQPNKTKLLLLLSDGIPADPDYGDSDGVATSSHALEDTRRAILESRRRGIVPYCLTIDSSARDYISHLYGDFSYSILDDVRLLPQRLARLYLRLTK